MFLPGYKNIYFLGIGGIGMSALARYFKHNGSEVSGYDKTATTLTHQLEAEGIRVHYEDLGEEVIRLNRFTPKDTLVVYTPAVPRDFGELNAFQKMGFTIKKRAAVLGMISDHYYTIAVAGTHGKTTTSTLIAHLLQESGKNVLAFLGGISANYHTNLILPELYEDVICVLEADEYDRSFLFIHPDISVITSTDADHMDIYGDEKALLESFDDFAGNLRKDGILIYKKGLEINTSAIGSMTYSIHEEAACTGSNIEIRDAAYYFDYRNDNGIHYEALLSGIPGWHNVENAVAAISAVAKAGLNEEQVRSGLASFTGVKRRFEYIINEPGRIFIDDYAHHPQELRAIISSVKELYPGKKITGAFQPHLYSRTRDFAEDFANSLSLLDEVILLDIYPARELPIPGISSAVIYDKINIPKTLCSKDELKQIIIEKDPEVLLTLGAGDIDTTVRGLGIALQLLSFEKHFKANDPELVFSRDEPMSKHTWLRIGGPADLFVKPKNNAAVTRIVEFAWQHKIPYFILGNGSNLLVGDRGIRGIVIAMGETETYCNQEDDHFRVSASYSLPKLVLDILKLGYEGLESLAGVPCTVGGATRMNAGAYGTELFDCLHSVQFIRDGTMQLKLKDEIDFSYRHTEFENDVILETVFTLNKAIDIDAVALKRKALLEKRKDAQPLDKPNTGSVFKNPLPEYAGKLIEDAGLKGFEFGKVQVSPKHANFLVNNGGASAKEFTGLVDLIKKKVKQEFNIDLETEVLYVGEF